MMPICLIRDIIAIKRLLTTPKREKESTFAITGVDNDPNISMQINLKSNAQSVLNLSNLLEKQWGRNNENGAQLIIDDITEQKNLEEELRNLSLTDPLTSVYNRRYFIKKLEEEFERVKRQSGSTFSVALLDTDHFKSINDCFGHNAGDIVLIKLTETINNRIRKIDCLARWGGEEFIILFPNTKLDAATLLIEELRNSISKMYTSFSSKITVSIGVVEYCSDETVDSLIQRADNLMYAAKNAGRNCVRNF